jgi:Zn-dependent protease/CBS domain-containing protein
MEPGDARQPGRAAGERHRDQLRGSLELGRIGGVSVRVHWTAAALFALIVWGTAAITLPRAYPDEPAWAYATAGLVGSVVFLLGLLAHEVSHAVVARRHGIEVESITLWFLGGVAQLGGEAADPGTEFRVAGIGPLVSLLVGGACAVAAVLLRAFGVTGLVLGTTLWLAAINVLLAIFNLIPAAPLDGGRVLRALLWWWRGDRDWATSVATHAGRLFGSLLIALGLVQFLVTGAVGALWLAIIGWFVVGSAAMEERQGVLRRSLRGVLVRDVMSRHPDTVGPEVSVAEFIDRYLFWRHHSTFPLVEDGRVVGLVTLRRVKRVPPERRAGTTLREIACPARLVPAARPDEPLVDVIPRVNASEDGRALVFDGPELVGILSPTDVSRAIEHAALLNRTPTQPLIPPPRPTR